MGSGPSDNKKKEQITINRRRDDECRRISIPNVQNILLIWLDNNIDENNEDCQHTITQLRLVVHSIHTFVDDDQCIEFIQGITNTKACLIVSGSLGQNIVLRVHDMSQIDSIFIFCSNKTRHSRWIKKWPKIKGIFTDIKRICDALKKTAQQCEQNASSISFVIPNKNLNQLDPSFMYTQILKEILLTITFEEKHIKEYIDYCRDVFAENNRELYNIEQLELNYHTKTPIGWYTHECFLYPMLNRALRLMNGDIIIRMGFFINDLHRHIEQLYQEQYTSRSAGKAFTVYRGQGLSKKEFDQMIEFKGGLMSFNNFLSTSKNRQVSFRFARNTVRNPDLFGILFIIKIDPSQSTTPFASIRKISTIQKENEVLFSMHTVFRIHKIQSIRANKHLYKVNLALTSDQDQDLCVLTEQIRQESFPKATGWYRLGLVLDDMGQFDKAAEIYEILLNQSSNENTRAPIYGQLGSIKCKQGKYSEALVFYEKALTIYQKTHPSGHPELARIYNNIVTVKRNMSNYSEAVLSHETALAIQQQALPTDHPDVSSSYNNIGNVHYSMGDYSKALSYYEKDLEIQQQLLPPNHPSLAKVYNNMGAVYQRMGDYLKALLYYEKTLFIRQQSLPSNHPDMAAIYDNIGTLYGITGEYVKALSYFEEALEISGKMLPPNHPSLASSYNNIGNVFHNLGDYSKALNSYEKALAIQQQSLPSNHPDLASSYNNIGTVYDNMGDYSNALLSHKKALTIREQSLPSNHPNLALSYNNMAVLYEKANDYTKACLFYEQAISVAQQSLPSNHPHLQMYRNQLENIKKKL